MKWSYLDSGFRPGEENMRLDEELANDLLACRRLPTLRVYGWNPPAVSIGFHQSVEEFNVTKLRDAGVDIVRRPTGGRAILHAHELTYSVVVRKEERTLHEVYRWINEGLLRGLQLLGVDAELVAVSNDARALYRNSSTAPCFVSAAKSEIQWRGRKILGSAQRRYGDVVLQHGSLLLGPEHARLAEYLVDPLPTGAETSRTPSTADHLRSHAVDVESILGRRVTFESAAAAVKSGFEEQLTIEFIDEIPRSIEHPSHVLQPVVQ